MSAAGSQGRRVGLEQEAAKVLGKIAANYEDLLGSENEDQDVVADLAHASILIANRFLDTVIRKRKHESPEMSAGPGKQARPGSSGHSTANGRGNRVLRDDVGQVRETETLEPSRTWKLFGLGARRQPRLPTEPGPSSLNLPADGKVVQPGFEDPRTSDGVQAGKILGTQVRVARRQQPSRSTTTDRGGSIGSATGPDSEDFREQCRLFEKYIRPHVRLAQLANAERVDTGTLYSCLRNCSAMSKCAPVVRKLVAKVLATTDDETDGRLIRGILGFPESSRPDVQADSGKSRTLGVRDKPAGKLVAARTDPDHRIPARIKYDELVRPYVPDTIITRALGKSDKALDRYIAHRTNWGMKWTTSPMDVPMNLLLRVQQKGAGPEALLAAARAWASNIPSTPTSSSTDGTEETESEDESASE
jgi:hypothetical protein